MKKLTRNSSERIAEAFLKKIKAIGLTPDRLLNVIQTSQIIKTASRHESNSLDRIASLLRKQKINEIKINDLSLLHNILERTVGIEAPDNIRRSWLTRKIVFFRKTLFTFVGVFSVLLLISALIGGHSSVHFFHNNSWIALGAVAFLLGAVFLLEGTQISVASLRMKDIEYLSDVTPSIKRLHNHFRNGRTVQNYLAGRQLLTIFAVFLISRICSFPNLNYLPLLQSEIPSFMQPWFKILFFEFGLLAAFVTLWLASLAPQFWANKQPIRFLSLFGASGIVFFSELLEKIGVTDFGAILTKSLKPEKPIPTSAREIFNSFSITHGYSAVSLWVHYQLTEDKVKIKVEEDFVFHQSGLTRLQVDQEIQNGEIGKRTTFEAVRQGHQLVVDVTHNEPLRFTNREIQTFIIRPRQASFLNDDLIKKILIIEVDRKKSHSRRINITRPLRYALVTLESPENVEMGLPRIHLIDERRAGNFNDYSRMYSLDQVSSVDGLIYYAQFLPFPSLDMIYEFSWEKDF